MSRIIRSVNFQSQEEQVREIKIQRIFEEEALPDMGEGEALTMAEVYRERDLLLTKARETIAAEQQAFAEERQQLLDEVEQLAQHVTSFSVTHHRMEIYGVCPECQNKNK